MRETEFNDFVNEINTYHETIKYSGEASRDTINFLDVTVYTDSEGFLHTKPYSKPTDAHIYLDFTSYHPEKQKLSIPYSQAIRLRRICSDTHDFDTSSKLLLGYFLNRGYPYKLLTESIRKARSMDRDSLLTTNMGNPKRIIPYITEFNHHNAYLAKKFYNTRSKVKVPGSQYTDRTMMTYRRSRNLKDLLVRTRYPVTTSKSGCTPCGNCPVCPRIQKTDIVHSTHNSYSHRISGYIDCNSANIIYMITCNRCRLQYIGQTSNSLSRRYTEHINSIRRKDDVSLSNHYHAGQHCINDLTIVGLETNARPLTTRLKLESAYIRIFETVHPKGLNAKF